MHLPKKYLQDRVVVLLIIVNVLLTVIASLLIVFGLSGNNNEGYIGEYRSDLGLSAFRPGSAATFISFMVFLMLTLAFHVLLSMRVYRVHRQLALIVLALGTLLIVLAAIVSNALLGLR